MEIKYEKQKTSFTFFTGLVAITALGIIIAIPTAIVWGAIYATTLFIGTLLGG